MRELNLTGYRMLSFEQANEIFFCSEVVKFSSETQNRCKRLILLARPEGFEPPTTWFVDMIQYIN
jgi:hypothetical protein